MGAGGCGRGMKAQGPGGGTHRRGAEAASTARCSGEGVGGSQGKEAKCKESKGGGGKESVAREADMKGGARQGRDERATARVLLPPPHGSRGSVIPGELAPLMWWPAAVCGRLSPTAPHRDFPGGGEAQHKTHDLTIACEARRMRGPGAPRRTPRQGQGQPQAHCLLPRGAAGKGKGYDPEGHCSKVVTHVCKGRDEPGSDVAHGNVVLVP